MKAEVFPACRFLARLNLFQHHPRSQITNRVSSQSDLLHSANQSPTNHNPQLPTMPNNCGCRIVHPAPRRFPNCTKNPNPELPCYNFDPPTSEYEGCRRSDVAVHNPEHIYPASSTKRQGNCPNHRDKGVWFQNEKQQPNLKTGSSRAGGAGRGSAVVR